MEKWTEANLLQAAYHYLARFASNRARLVRVLRQKVARRGFYPAEQSEAAITRIVARCEDMALIDERGYAEARARLLVQRGMGLHRICQDLTAYGVPADLADTVVAMLASDDGGIEVFTIQAALTLARKKRLGPFGREDPRSDLKVRRRQMAAFARAGIGAEIACRILDAGTPDDLLIWAEEAGVSSV